MARQTKCIFCNEKDSIEKVKFDNKFLHHECVAGYQKQKQQKAIEHEQFCELYEYIKTLVNCLDIPPRNIKRLHEIKQSKNVTYKLMLEGFKIAEDKIKWFMSSVRNGGNNAEDINAYITIMLNSGLNAAHQNEKMRLKREQEKSINNNNVNIDYVERVIAYKQNKQQSSSDISDFL